MAGGGIAGLTAAVALHQMGVQCRVWESAPAFTDAGTGIGLWGSCLSGLEALGLGERLHAEGRLMHCAGQCNGFEKTFGLKGRDHCTVTASTYTPSVTLSARFVQVTETVKAAGC